MARTGEPLPAEIQQQALEAAQLMVREVDGTILHWTRGMEDLYGWSREQAVGRKSHDVLQTVFPRPLAEIEAELTKKGAWAGELIHTRSNGERLVAASHWSLWQHIVVEVDNDVTAERHALETRAKLSEVQSELFHVSRLNTVSHMASGLAHELNQPLAAITNYLKGAQRLLGERTDELSNTLKNALNKASEQSLRAGEIVRRLRNFMSRSETEFKVESLSQLVKETSQLALLGGIGVKVTFALDASVDSVLIDRIKSSRC